MKNKSIQLLCKAWNTIVWRLYSNSHRMIEIEKLKEEQTNIKNYKNQIEILNQV